MLDLCNSKTPIQARRTQLQGEFAESRFKLAWNYLPCPFANGTLLDLKFKPNFCLGLWLIHLWEKEIDSWLFSCYDVGTGGDSQGEGSHFTWWFLIQMKLSTWQPFSPSVFLKFQIHYPAASIGGRWWTWIDKMIPPIHSVTDSKEHLRKRQGAVVDDIITPQRLRIGPQTFLACPQ